MRSLTLHDAEFLHRVILAVALILGARGSFLDYPLRLRIEQLGLAFAIGVHAQLDGRDDLITSSAGAWGCFRERTQAKKLVVCGVRASRCGASRGSSKTFGCECACACPRGCSSGYVSGYISTRLPSTTGVLRVFLSKLRAITAAAAAAIFMLFLLVVGPFWLRAIRCLESP